MGSKKEVKNKKEEAEEPMDIEEPNQSPGKRRSGRALKKISEPAVKKMKISPKKNITEEKSLPEVEASSSESMSEIISGLMARVKHLETKPNPDRDFLMNLTKRSDLPKAVKNVIVNHLKK